MALLNIRVNKRFSSLQRSKRLSVHMLEIDNTFFLIYISIDILHLMYMIPSTSVPLMVILAKEP